MDRLLGLGVYFLIFKFYLDTATRNGSLLTTVDEVAKTVGKTDVPQSCGLAFKTHSRNPNQMS
jgi:hypothetical protein